MAPCTGKRAEPATWLSPICSPDMVLEPEQVLLGFVLPLNFNREKGDSAVSSHSFGNSGLLVWGVN